MFDPTATEHPLDRTGEIQAGAVPDLSSREFTRICRLVHRSTGIHLTAGKEQLVKTRLWKRLRVLGLMSFTAYVDLLESPQRAEELTFFIDAITTNKTQFLREPQHLEFLRSRLRGATRSRTPITLWSAGCSSGEEPYSIAMTILEELGPSAPERSRLLATDISQEILRRARAGVYDEGAVAEVPPQILERYFAGIRSRGRNLFRIRGRVRRMVQFAHLNLLAPWPMHGPFDFIFCRNVMIYFDRPTQQDLLARFRTLLRRGGHLFLGHAESLAGQDQGFVYVKPAVYRR